jgi:hypothetical protein
MSDSMHEDDDWREPGEDRDGDDDPEAERLEDERPPHW